AVNGFGATVGRTGGVEVGQERGLPAFQGAAEPGDLGYRAGRETVDDLFGQLPPHGSGGLMVDLPQLLGALPGHKHLQVTFVGLDRFRQPDLLPFGEPFLGAAQQIADAVERVVLAAAVTVDGLLYSTP